MQAIKEAFFMSTLAIEGMQWGDEGKGKIVDYYAAKADIVVRSQGGNNAGHSIQRNGVRFALRLLPSGILNPRVTNVIADGVVANPDALIQEIEGLREKGVTDFHLLISSRATVLMPYHIAMDAALENALGDQKIGTTKNGIGPCYEDRAARLSIRYGDLLHPDYLRQRLHLVVPIKNKELSAFGAEPFDEEALYQQLMEDAKKLGSIIVDTPSYLRKAYQAGKKILFEGAQGAMLCLNYGTFPYVTSSSPLATAIPNNTGLPLEAVNGVLGIVKAYTTRVGEGPFPSEIEGEAANKIRERGHEYGTVTKRPRRIGWLDIPQLRYVASISGIKHIALMLIDVLGVVDEIKILTKYTIDGKEIDYMPASLPEFEKVKGEFITLPSWKEDVSGCRKFEELPEACQNYVKTIEKLLGVSVNLISVSPEEQATIIRGDLFHD